MSTYTELRGLKVKYLAANPDPGTAGDVWYDGAAFALKGIVGRAAWSAGSNLGTATVAAAALGIQTAGLITSGYGEPSTPAGIPQTQIYNGSGWAAGGNINETRVYFQGGGTTTAGVVFGGVGGPDNPG